MWQSIRYETDKKTNSELTQWGLCLEEIEQLGEKLGQFFQYYAPYLRTKTRDTSQYGFHYLSGLLRMDKNRNMAQISRNTGQSEQNIHHFMSKSPWSGRDLVEALQINMIESGAFDDSVLVIDESANEKTGQMSVGVGRQHNGRLGKIDLCQVGVFATVATEQAHCWIDGELFIPEAWFNSEYLAKRGRVGLPQNKIFQTKVELALTMILRLRDRGVPFCAVDMDSLYGRSFSLRHRLQSENIEYYADIPANTRVFLEKPIVIFKKKKNGEAYKNATIIGSSFEVRYLTDHENQESEHLRLRPSERGYIEDRFSRMEVWTEKDGKLLQEWLLMRQAPSHTTFILSNASTDTPLSVMADRKTHRYFIERDNQDGKSEFGWDEFQATKFIAWEHQLAFTIMAAWFVTQTRLEWAEKFERDSALLQEYEVDHLPSLSVSNVRELLRAVMPLPQLSSYEAIQLVVKHLKNRTRSRKSRLRKLPER